MNRPLEIPKQAPGEVAPSTKYDPQREVFPRHEPSQADLTKVSSTPAPAGPATKVKIDVVVPKKR